MNDLFPPLAAPESIYSDALRIEPVIGDGMYPRLRSSFDFVLVRPVHRYIGEGTYVWHDGVAASLVNVQAMANRLRLWRENRTYPDDFMSKADFEEGILAIVVADIKVRRHDMLPEAQS